MIRQRNKICVQELSLIVSLLLEDTLLLCWTSYGGRKGETSSIQDQLGTEQLGKKEPSIHVTSTTTAFFSNTQATTQFRQLTIFQLTYRLLKYHTNVHIGI